MSKVRLTLLGIAVLVGAGVVVWYLVMERMAAKYQQSNASWRIQGLCTNAQDGTPVGGAQLTAYFSEPVAFKHKLFNMPLKGTNVVAKSDMQGRFELNGEGGRVQIKVRAEGYRDPESWEDWRYRAMNGVTRVDTNIALSLEPISRKRSKRNGP